MLIFSWNIRQLEQGEKERNPKISGQQLIKGFIPVSVECLPISCMSNEQRKRLTQISLEFSPKHANIVDIQRVMIKYLLNNWSALNLIST